MHTRPVSTWVAATRWASVNESASGISICTCLPARIVAMACSACSCVGVAKMTASTSGEAKTSSNDVVASRRAVLVGDLVRLIESPAHDRGDLDAIDTREGVEVLDAEGSGSSEGDAHVIPST